MKRLTLLLSLLSMTTQASNIDCSAKPASASSSTTASTPSPPGYWNGQPVKGAGEWIMNDAKIPVADYEKLKAQFNPKDFIAKDYVALAKSAGMKYIVITAKHHDGFCLWNTKLTDYNSQSSTANRDLIKELAEACQADKSVRFCAYYSITDWHHPDAIPASAPAAYTSFDPAYKPNPNFPRYIETYLKPQLKELITQYHPAILWFDGEWIPEYTETMGKEIDAYCRQLDPKILINNRVGKSRKGYEGFSQDKNSPGDFGTPEQQIPPTGLPGVVWESNMTMNETWGYKKDDTHYKPTRLLIQNLVDIASKGGNYLLNVGPTPEGKIPDQSIKSLNEIAKWMSTNSESIHNTTASPFQHLYFGRATTKSETRNPELGTRNYHVFLHQFLWNKSAPLIIPPQQQTHFRHATRRPHPKTNRHPNPHHHPNHRPTRSRPRPHRHHHRSTNRRPAHLHPTTHHPRKRRIHHPHRTGCQPEIQNARVEKKGDRPFNIGYWTNINDTASWQANLPQKSTYTVHIEYSLAPTCKGSQITLQFTSQNNTQSLQLDLKEGKDFLDFKTEQAGQLTLPEGPCTITLIPTKKPGVAVMDLRQIQIKPQ